MAGLNLRSSHCGACWCLPSRSIALRTCAPMTVDMSPDSISVRRPGLTNGLERSRRNARIQNHFDRGFVEKILTRAVSRVPVLEEVEVNPSSRVGRPV